MAEPLITGAPVAGEWSPNEAEWAKIDKELPPDAHIRKLHEEIILTVWLYFGTCSYFEAWRRIAKAAQSKSVDKLCREIDRLNPGPPGDAASWAREWAGSLEMLRAFADCTVRSLHTLWKERRELLYANLLTVCTRSGKLPLSISEGPLNRTMEEILTLVLPDPPDSRGIKDIIKREKDRRAKNVSVGGLPRLQ